ncbi:MAG: hypothetical protein JWQ09_1185, partial [Segetibacter sp.]|nr:hypothetical protein [Segetibacter sp.]
MKAIKITYQKAVIFFIGILLYSPAFSQVNDGISQQFERYSSQHLQEKVFVHTDKSFY